MATLGEKTLFYLLYVSADRMHWSKNLIVGYFPCFFASEANRVVGRVEMKNDIDYTTTLADPEMGIRL